MKDIILQMIERQAPQSLNEYDIALKEIIQRICLLGLWRSRFFEHAAFYGGTALRLLYGLDRFSEDLDFSLLFQEKNFRMEPFFNALYRELEGFGFEAEITETAKADRGQIAAGFIKSNTRLHLLRIGVPERLTRQIPANQLLKVKFEVDIDPPPGFDTEIRYILQPIPFSVRTFIQEDLFAGKMHALLCRRWGQRVKGRDWYDLVWFARQEIPLNLDHLATRMRQSGDLGPGEALTNQVWLDRLSQAIQDTEIDSAKKDVMPFLKDSSQLEIWSEEFFRAVGDMIQIR